MGENAFRFRAGQLFCACDSDGLPLDVGVVPDQATALRLALSFALSVLAQTLTISALPLASLALAPAPALQVWPYLGLLLGGALATFPASFLLDLFGRRAAFALGSSLGLAGGILAFWSVLNGAFLPFLIGIVWLGMAQGFGLFYRHAGSVSAHGATGLIFGAGIFAALLAPLLIKALLDVAGGDAQALCLLVAGFVYLLALALSVMLPARQLESETDFAAKPALRVVVWASLMAALAWALMSGVMAHAPLVMAGCGVSFDGSVLIMALHLMSMYAPGFVIGRLIALWGGVAVGLTGLLLLLGASILLPQQSAAWPMAFTMMLAGTGWGTATIGATAWLHQSGRPTAMMLACHDLFLFLGAMSGVATLSLRG
jgi:MFS family permease